MDTFRTIKTDDVTAVSGHEARLGARGSYTRSLNQEVAEAVGADVGDDLPHATRCDDSNFSVAGEEDPGAALDSLNANAG